MTRLLRLPKVIPVPSPLDRLAPEHWTDITRNRGPTSAESAEQFAGRNCAFHFRRRTRGSSHAENLHPFKLGNGLYLMHNGTAKVDIRLAGRSDTWHLVHDYLGPFLTHRRRLIYDRDFRHILDAWLGPQNRIVFLDEAEGRIELLHRADGIEWNGLWLSNARWVDRSLLSLDGHDGVYRATEASFC